MFNTLEPLINAFQSSATLNKLPELKNIHMQLKTIYVPLLQYRVQEELFVEGRIERKNFK